MALATALTLASQYRSRSRLNEQGLLQVGYKFPLFDLIVWIPTDNALRLRFVSLAKVRIFRQKAFVPSQSEIHIIAD